MLSLTRLVTTMRCYRNLQKERRKTMTTSYHSHTSERNLKMAQILEKRREVVNWRWQKTRITAVVRKRLKHHLAGSVFCFVFHHPVTAITEPFPFVFPCIILRIFSPAQQPLHPSAHSPFVSHSRVNNSCSGCLLAEMNHGRRAGYTCLSQSGGPLQRLRRRGNH